MARDPMHPRAAPILPGHAVAVRNERAPPAEVQLGLTAEELDSQIAGKEGAAPAVVVAAHERNGHAAPPDLLQLGDRGKVFAGDDALIFEPEVEQVAREDQVVAGAGR